LRQFARGTVLAMWPVMATEKLRSLVVTLATALTAGCLDRPVALTTPETTNLYVRSVAHREVEKLDLLFMIDNSMSMTDKQEILSDAVPVLVRRLVTPNCVDELGNPTGTVTDAEGRCAQGKPEMRAVKDIHIGVITSSLGSHGGFDSCVETASSDGTLTTPDDRAELLPSANPAVRGSLPSWNQSGFLAWDPGQNKNTPPGEANVDQLIRDFGNQVVAAGEVGCGFESSLEAWYRFLVDPEPPASVGTTQAGTFLFSSKGPVNEALLAQRKAFLRPDSLLAIVMLTDENDCSIVDEDGSQGWLVASTRSRMPRASAACVNPDDPCCHSCAAEAPPGCTPNNQDAECSKIREGDTVAWLTSEEDQPNARCFDQRRRFGLDLLYPVKRYVNALTERQVPDRSGKMVQNPLFAPDELGQSRAPDLVLLAGIVGVPWQDISTEESWTGEGLEYLTARELADRGRWDVILGNGSGPTDPLMRESVTPRTGTHPLLGIPVAPATSTNPRENPINGHEQVIPLADDLQYACTFPLTTPRSCATENPSRCDCNADEYLHNRSLCDYPDGPNTEGIQHSAKAYPGVRTLEVLRGIGDNAIVASICPKNSAPAAGLPPEADPSYGYNPAVQSILSIFKDRLGGQCLPRALPVETDPALPNFGQVPCSLIEATRLSEGPCACDESRGRLPLTQGDAKLPGAVLSELRQNEQCGGATGIDCRDLCLCKIAPLEGTELTACQSGSEDPNVFGYCYVDPSQGIGAPSLVEGCDPTLRRMLRFMGEGLPKSGSVLYTACLGATYDDGP
jgi:hypothetical protein